MESILNVEIQDSTAEEIGIKLVSIHSHSACNLVVWKDLTEQGTEWNNVEKRIAIVMDRLADLLHDYQRFAPLVALIDLQAKSAKWAKLMGDQDWHRGRFVLQGVKSYDNQLLEQVKNRWLGALQISQYTPRRITNEDFTGLLNEAVESAKPPTGSDQQLFVRYADNLKSSIESGQTTEMARLWEKELLMDINNLLGNSILEVSAFGE